MTEAEAEAYLTLSPDRDSNRDDGGEAVVAQTHLLEAKGCVVPISQS